MARSRPRSNAALDDASESNTTAHFHFYIAASQMVEEVGEGVERNGQRAGADGDVDWVTPTT
ncbi:MAG: hypothetical protein R3C16_13570 [Hyphomonadaceae bacterium]